MSAEVVSLIERRLSRGGIKILFFKSILKQSSVVESFPGGLEAFSEHYQNSVSHAGLLAVTFMSVAQMDRFVEEMKWHGLLAGRDLATANQLHGVVIACAGIEFVPFERPVNSGANIAFPVWYARAESPAQRI